MAVIEIEVGDDGSVVKVPEQVQKLIDKAFGQGQAKAVDEAQKQIAELRKSANPVDKEKLTALELQNSQLREAEALREKNYQEAERIRNERHAAELTARDERLKAHEAELAKRTDRVRELVASQVRIEALKHGARDESLPELELLLGRQIGLDDALQAVVQDSAGKPLLDKDGKPVSIEGLVSQYLTDHPHHKAAPAGRGGRGAGGRSLTGLPQTGVDAEKSAALDAVATNPSVSNVAAAFSRIGKRGAA